MNTSATNRRLRLLLTAIGNGTLIPQPSFQRRLVWSNKDKVNFVKTVLEGYPFPEIYIAAGSVNPKTGEGIELLVDGQQRVTTLYQYFKNSPDLKLSNDMKAYDNLTEEEKINFLEYEVVIRDLGNKPIEVIKEIFQRINSTSYGLNTMEIHNARYGGEFKEFGEKISLHPFFEQNRIFTSTDVKRMNDIRYCLSLIITTISTYFTRDNELETYLEKYNETFDLKENIETEYNIIFDTLTKLNFSQNCRIFKKADFFSLFVELHRFIIKDKNRINLKKTKENLESFYSNIDNITEVDESDNDFFNYYKAALQATNDRNNRILRGKIIYNLLEKN